MSVQPAQSTQPNLTSSSVGEDGGRCPKIWFAATILIGAFLVFQVQPVISKCVLPWFGGTPAVWTTCMLFFQLLLFCGYAYAHLLRSWFGPVMQGVIHLVLLSAAALMLPIEPSDAWKPTGSESPTIHLLVMLARHVGLPYFVLSSTGPLVQAWLSYRDDSDRVYRLYALSNAGSLGALLSYPFLVEPFLSVSNQSTVWSLMFCGFVLVQGVVAISLFRVPRASTATKATSDNAAAIEADALKPWQQRTLWLALPALASTMLLVVTNHVCQDIAVVPFLWVLPLSLYLLSFIVCFDSPQWYQPKWIAAVTLLSVFTIQVKHLLPISLRLIVEASSFMTLLFGVCLLCHGEVARLKPRASLLTQFYMMLSAGGAIGGVIVAILCPLLLSTRIELPLVLSLSSALAFVLYFATKQWRQASYDWSAAYRLKYAVMLLMVAPMVTVALAPQGMVVASQRNFFGVLQVLETDTSIDLVHGTTVHGSQRKGEHADQATTYYGTESGVGLTIAALQQQHDRLEIGIIGLGCGVLATYGRDADEYDMLEINPDVVDIANEYFTFLRDSRATIRTHLGDGRLVLERMPNRRFDLLVLDAFSSDAIPAHLLTREAFALYRQRIKAGGVLAVHVSNNHLDLAPLVHRLSDDSGLESRVIESPGDSKRCIQRALWVIVADRDHELWQHELLSEAQPASKADLADAPMWTDQSHDLLSVLKLW